MGVGGAVFTSAGQRSVHYRPGAYSRRNFIPNAGGGVSSGNVCIFGPCETGEPMKLLVFGSANDARAELTAGEGLDGVIQAFDPGNDLIPQQIGFMRVNDGDQASRVLQNTGSDIFNVLSFSWGSQMNQVKLKFSAGTTSGTRKIETEYQGVSYSKDNIQKESLQIQYIGAGSAAVMTIDGTHLATTVTGGPGGEDLNLTFASFPNISAMVAAINSNTAYAASVITGVPTDLCSELDAVTSQDILSAVYTAKSDVAAVLKELNNADFLGICTYIGTSRVLPDNDADFVYLSGGSYGSYTTTEWTAALLEAEEEDIQLISTPSTELAVHVLIKNHCVKMNGVEGKKERQFYVGGPTGESIATIISNALTLNSSFGSLCSPGYYQYNDSGVSVLWAPSYFACKQVGMLSALALNNPTTWKTMNVLSWENTYKTTEQDQLIQGGVLIGGKKPNGVLITIRSVTTYQDDSLPQNEASIMRETLYQDRDLRSALENALIGTPLLGNSQLAIVDSIFSQKISQWQQEGIIVPGPDGTSLYSGYTKRIDGDQISIEYNTWNTSPNNFVFITHNVDVLRQG